MSRTSLNGFAIIALTSAASLICTPAASAGTYWWGRYWYGGSNQNAQDAFAWTDTIDGGNAAGFSSSSASNTSDIYFSSNSPSSASMVWGDFTDYSGSSLTFNSNVAGGFTFNGTHHDTRWTLNGSNANSGYQIDVQSGAGTINFFNGSTNPDNATIVMNTSGTWNNSSAGTMTVGGVLKRNNAAALSKTGTGPINFDHDQSLTDGLTIQNGLLSFDNALTVDELAFGLDPASSSPSRLVAKNITFQANTFALTLTGAPTAGQQFTIIETTVGTITEGLFGTSTSATYGSQTYNFDILYNQSGNNVVLSVVPEPAALSGLGLAGLLLLRRRR